MARTEGSLKQTGERCWMVRVYKGQDGTGRRVYVSKAVHGTRKEAEKVLRAMLEEKGKGRLVRTPRRTVEEYLGDWLSNSAAGRVSGRTLSFYRTQVALYIAPALGPIMLGKLTPEAVQRWVNELGERGLSTRTVRAAYGTLNTALRQAVKWKLLPGNPAGREIVELAKPKKKRPPVVLEAEQLATFLQAAQGERMAAFFMVAAATAARPGELAALAWRDVNLKNGTIRIRQAVTWDADGKPLLASTKTERGNREITLPAAAVAALKNHQTAMKAERLRAGGAWLNPELVFVNETGSMLSPQDLANLRRRALRRVARKAFPPAEHIAACAVCTMPLWLRGSRKLCPEGKRLLADVDAITLYSLRHSSASALLHAGVNPKALSERLGHASEAFTLATYVQSREDVQREAAEKLQSAVFAGIGTA